MHCHFSEGDEIGSLIKCYKNERLRCNPRRYTELQAVDTVHQLLLTL
jgi:hypothetical protein